jgi:hypothetical protein
MREVDIECWVLVNKNVTWYNLISGSRLNDVTDYLHSIQSISGKCLWQVEHILGSLWQICHNGQPSHGGAFNFSKRIPWFSSFLVSWNTSRSFSHSRLITGFVTRLTRRVPLVEQELLTLPEHMSSFLAFSGVLEQLDRTQIITIYKGPLHIINNYNSTCVSNNKLQYTTL